jgi:hypothetical protein
MPASPGFTLITASKIYGNLLGQLLASGQITFTPVNNAGVPISFRVGGTALAGVAITAWSITGNVVTFTAANTLTAGVAGQLSGFATGTFFNGKDVEVLSSGLSGTQFEAAFTQANAAATEAGAFTPLGGEGQMVSTPMSFPVVNGAIVADSSGVPPQLPDTTLTYPVNVGYAVSVINPLTGKNVFPSGLGCAQPSGATWSLDTYNPNMPALATVQYGPQGTVGTAGANGTNGSNGTNGAPGTLTGNYVGPLSLTRLNLGTASEVGFPTTRDHLLTILDPTGRKVLASIENNLSLTGFDTVDVRLPASGVSTDVAGNVHFANSLFAANLTPLVALGPNTLGLQFMVLDSTGRRVLQGWDAQGNLIGGPQSTTIPVLWGTLPTPPPTSASEAPLTPSGFVAALNHVTITGESTSVGAQSTPLLTTTQPFNNVMFNGDVNSPTSMSSLVPLIEVAGTEAFYGQYETCANGFADHIASKVVQKRMAHVLLMSGSGSSGYTYAQLAGPTTYGGSGAPDFVTMMSQITAGKSLAGSGGYAHTAIINILGINDADAGNGSTYGPDMVIYQSDIQNGSNAITGQSATIPMFMPQPAYYLLSLLPSVVANSKLLKIVCPSYVGSRQTSAEIAAGSDNVHFDGYGERTIGEYLAKAYAYEILQGREWRPLAPSQLIVGKNWIEVVFAGPDQTPIAIDTSVYSDPGNSGFAYSDPVGAQIASVAVISSNTIKITFDRAIALSGRTLTYAFIGANGTNGQLSPFGLRGCVRNTSPEMSYYPGASGSVYPLYDYCIQFSQAF